jgi:hypothetical protein
VFVHSIALPCLVGLIVLAYADVFFRARSMTALK